MIAVNKLARAIDALPDRIFRRPGSAPCDAAGSSGRGTVVAASGHAGCPRSMVLSHIARTPVDAIPRTCWSRGAAHATAGVAMIDEDSGCCRRSDAGQRRASRFTLGRSAFSARSRSRAVPGRRGIEVRPSASGAPHCRRRWTCICRPMRLPPDVRHAAVHLDAAIVINRRVGSRLYPAYLWQAASHRRLRATRRAAGRPATPSSAAPVGGNGDRLVGGDAVNRRRSSYVSD